MRKIKIPTKEQKQIENLNVENATLWYKNMQDEVRIESTKQEIAVIWYEIAIGGM